MGLGEVYAEKMETSISYGNIIDHLSGCFCFLLQNFVKVVGTYEWYYVCVVCAAWVVSTLMVGWGHTNFNS